MDSLSIWATLPLISSLCNILLDRLASQKMRELLMGYDLTFAELWRLSSSLMSIMTVIKDAEESQEFDLNFIAWINEVKHAVYDDEDLIDEIYTTALSRKVDVDTQSSYSNETDVSLDPSHEGIESRIREVNQRLASLCDGREFERKRIVKILEGGVSGECEKKRLMKGKNVIEHENIRVIVIVGKPGIGKTTLAHLIFNDPRVDKIFYPKKWICVPKVFDPMKVISEFVNVEPRASYIRAITEDMHVVQKNLRSHVAGKRILIVLDDVSEISNANWEELLFSLKSASPGSTIIVTTRNEDIATTIYPILVQQLQVLSDGVAWSFFKALSFNDPEAAKNEKLESLGRKIIAKCGGLPLAVKVIGRLLGCSLGDYRE